MQHRVYDDVKEMVNRIRRERGADPLFKLPEGIGGDAMNCVIAEGLKDVVPNVVVTAEGIYSTTPNGRPIEVPLSHEEREILAQFVPCFDMEADEETADAGANLEGDEGDNAIGAGL